jgi:hypothetical protein
VAAIEVDVLTRVENVEPADPQPDGEAKQPGLAASASTGRHPSTDWCHRKRQAEEHLRICREALGQRIPEHDQQRDWGQRQAQRR